MKKSEVIKVRLICLYSVLLDSGVASNEHFTNALGHKNPMSVNNIVT